MIIQKSVNYYFPISLLLVFFDFVFLVLKYTDLLDLDLDWSKEKDNNKIKIPELKKMLVYLILNQIPCILVVNAIDERVFSDSDNYPNSHEQAKSFANEVIKFKKTLQSFIGNVVEFLSSNKLCSKELVETISKYEFYVALTQFKPCDQKKMSKEMILKCRSVLARLGGFHPDLWINFLEEMSKQIDLLLK